MKQRLSVARVLLHDPRVLLLDEPASGLDPRARIELRELLKELRRMGKTIIISSHILHELAELCTTVGIIEQGELLHHSGIEEIIQQARRGTRIHVRVAARIDEAARLISALDGVRDVITRDGQLVVQLDRAADDFSFIAKALVEAGMKIRGIREEEVNLETAFMRLTKGVVQ